MVEVEYGLYAHQFVSVPRPPQLSKLKLFVCAMPIWASSAAPLGPSYSAATRAMSPLGFCGLKLNPGASMDDRVPVRLLLPQHSEFKM
jgi:hypothetical protein